MTRKLLLVVFIAFLFACNKEDGYNVSNGNGGNTSSDWHYCGHSTTDGTPCQRHVSGTTGYCWQHK